MGLFRNLGLNGVNWAVWLMEQEAQDQIGAFSRGSGTGLKPAFSRQPPWLPCLGRITAVLEGLLLRGSFKKEGWILTPSNFGSRILAVTGLQGLALPNDREIN